jgi:arginine decarboxylase
VRQAVVSDVTCDCEGVLNCFIGAGGRQPTIPVHPLRPGEDYRMGVFLIGAYQETLGDLHNLLGDTGVVTVRLRNGRISYSRQLEGDSAEEVLSYLEYTPRDLLKRFRALTEDPVSGKKLADGEAEAIYRNYRRNLKSYTYFSS